MPAIVWLQVETKIGIVGACLPMMPPLIRLLRETLGMPSFMRRIDELIRSWFTRTSGMSDSSQSPIINHGGNSKILNAGDDKETNSPGSVSEAWA